MAPIIRRTARAYSTYGDTQDIPRGGMKRTTRRVERAQLAQETRAELRAWQSSEAEQDD